MSPLESLAIIACGIAAVVLWARLVWLIVFQPWVERVSDYLRVRRDKPEWFL